AMTSKHKPFSGWEKLEEKIWNKYKFEPAYYFLNSKYINWAAEKLQTDFSDKNIKNAFLKQALNSCLSPSLFASFQITSFIYTTDIAFS
ncbi:MAG: hypothetical protein CO003_00220, partial [Candidatus Portnoybacteria bacterium CG_4_8_14_3_um_filter_44_15]